MRNRQYAQSVTLHAVDDLKRELGKRKSPAVLVEWLSDERRIGEQLENPTYLDQEFAPKTWRALLSDSHRSCKLATGCRVKSMDHFFSEASRARKTSTAGIVSTAPSSIS